MKAFPAAVFSKSGRWAAWGWPCHNFWPRRTAQAAPAPSTVTNCILIWTRGGTSHHDTFDPKPEAPASVKGEFGVIDTAIPGVKFTDIVPNMARELGRFALLRGWNPKNGSHGSADQWVMSGRRFNPAVAYPTYGSVVSYYHGFKSAMPPFVQLGDNVDNRFGGGTAGVLGLEHNPFAMLADPNAKNFSVRDITPPKGISMDRVDRRRKMLSVIDDLQRETDLQPAAFEALDEHYKAALNMITAPETKKAFEIDSEDPKLRDRYGRHRFGQSCLLARRLIQAGVRFVTVTDGGWDTHQNNFKSLKSSRIPPVDQALPELLTDLEQRGMLESTLGFVADRLRPHAEDQLRQRPGPLGECRVCDHGRRGHPRRRGVGRDRRRRRPADSATNTSAKTSPPRFTRSWASRPTSWSNPPTAARCASSKATRSASGRKPGFAGSPNDRAPTDGWLVPNDQGNLAGEVFKCVPADGVSAAQRTGCLAVPMSASLKQPITQNKS